MKYIIDRFEEDQAVCEDESGNMIHIDRAMLPSRAAEGDVVRITAEGIIIDADATVKRRTTIEKLAKDLWID